MQLREHPLMFRRSGWVSWPPQWQAIGPLRSDLTGEVGTLEDVSMNELITNKIFLRMEYRADRYIAILAFDDEMFARQLYPLLIQNIGRSLREIGDLDLSRLL